MTVSTSISGYECGMMYHGAILNKNLMIYVGHDLH